MMELIDKNDSQSVQQQLPRVIIVPEAYISSTWNMQSLNVYT